MDALSEIGASNVTVVKMSDANLSEARSVAEPDALKVQQRTVCELSSKAFTKLEKRLRRQVGEAISDYSMIEEGDKIMVCLSGGKDSYTMLDILLYLQRVAPVSFEVVAVNLDQKQPDFPEHILPRYLDVLGIEYHIIEKDTYSIVKGLTPEGKTFCPICSRMRRGALYGFATEIGATKIALGHHREDIMETFFMNLFFNGTVKAMPPKLRSDDGKNIVIRPLAYCKEADIIAYSQEKDFPIIPCNLCGTQENMQRQNIKGMLNQWDQEQPGRLESIFSGIGNVKLSQMTDKNLFDFDAFTMREQASAVRIATQQE